MSIHAEFRETSRLIEKAEILEAELRVTKKIAMQTANEQASEIAELRRELEGQRELSASALDRCRELADRLAAVSRVNEQALETADLRLSNAIRALKIARDLMDPSHVPAMMCVNEAIRSAAIKTKATA